MDALTSLADGLNLRAKLAYAGGVCGEWVMDHNSDRSVWFHLLTKGRGWVHAPTWETPLPLEDGDLALFFPHAAQHYLSHSRDRMPADRTGMRPAGWEEGEAAFVCGEIELGMPASPLWQAMPAEIVIRRAEGGPILARLVDLVIGESAQSRFGSAAVVERLCDSLFLLVMRHCVENGLVRQGVFAAMRDRRLATVLNLIHREPWHRWSIAELCAQAGLSKTVLSERFAATVGASPIEYLANWRMQIAARWLKESALPVDRVAERCGYESAAAFNKAFRRCFGTSPGAYRKASG